MKCHEFMEAAESLSPSQLTQLQGEQSALWEHARECASCGRWMESNRLLGNALGALRAATVQREAGPATEAAVLRAFRTQGFAPKVVVMPERTAPAMFRLSRFFEVGAYAAVAAALIVGLFLGSRILRDRQAQTQQLQAKSSSVQQKPTEVTPAVVNGGEVAKVVESEKPARSTVAESAVLRTKQPVAAKGAVDASAADQAGYVAVMLCDPLICSGDEQVIRMELPATVTTDASSTQPVLADVVVGEDGLVRAMRIVHE